MSARRHLGAALVALLLTACAQSALPARTAEAPTPNLAARAAAATICPLAVGRLAPFAVAPAHADAGVNDAYVRVRSCTATPRAGGVAIAASASLWLAVKVEAAGARVDQFVHATASVDLVYALDAVYENGVATLSLVPLAPPLITVVPLGALHAEPLNWATWLTSALTPAIGTTPEWVAKGAVKRQAEALLGEALAGALSLVVDARHDRVTGAARPDARGHAPERGALGHASVVVAPRGMALVGPFTSPQSVLRSASPGAPPSLRLDGICEADVDETLARDRRGDTLDLTSWTEASPSVPVLVGARGCPFYVALRTAGDASFVADLALTPVPDSGASPRAPWVVVSSVDVAPLGDLSNAQIAIIGGDERVRVFPAPQGSAPSALPHVFVMRSGQALRVELTERDGIASAARVVIDLGEGRDPHVVVIDGRDGPLARVTVRLQTASPLDDASVRP